MKISGAAPAWRCQLISRGIIKCYNMHEAREGAEEGGEFRPAGPAAVLWAKGLLG